MWSCALCTLRNDEAAAECDACGSAKPPATGNAAPASSAGAASRPLPRRAEGEPFIGNISDNDSDELEVLPAPPPPRQSPPARQASVPPATHAAAASASLPPAPRPVAPAALSPPVRASSTLPPAASSSPPVRALASASSPVVRSNSVAAAAASPRALAPAPLGLSRSNSAALKTAERAARADEKARERATKASAKEALRADKVVEKLVAKCHRGAFAEQEIRLLLHSDFSDARFARLRSGLQESKLAFSFPTAPGAAASAAHSAAAHSSAASSAAAAAPCSASSLSVLRSLPRCVVWERQQAPEAVTALRAHKRARHAAGPAGAWRSMEEESARAEELLQREAAELAHKRTAGLSAAPDLLEELPLPQPVNSVAVVLSGAEFLELHSTAQLRPALGRWLALLDRHTDGSKTVLLVVYGLYALVQIEATQAPQQRRADTLAKQNGLPSSAASSSSKPLVKPLKKLSEVDALLASLWFSTQARVRFKMLADEAECCDWLLALSSALAKAPYKESGDSAVTLVNTGRTDRMRGGDDFRIRADPNSDDSDGDDGDGAAVRRRRQAAKSTLSESWRLYLMQIPRVSERIALCIARAYPTLRRLWDAYRALPSDKARENLVADLVVSAAPAGGAPTARGTRVGPALSKALFQAIWTKQTDAAPAAAAEEDAQLDSMIE